MKIQTNHFEHIKNAINSSGNNTMENLFKYLSNGMTEKRFRWDLLYASVPSVWICDNIYPYANDEHIDTVLNKIAVSSALKA